MPSSRLIPFATGAQTLLRKCPQCHQLRIPPDSSRIHPLQQTGVHQRSETGEGWETSLADLKRWLEGPRDRRFQIEAGLPEM